MVPLALVVPLLCLTSQADYSGRYRSHPQLAAIEETIERVAAEAPEELPDWLAEEPPTFEVILVDQPLPYERHGWPGWVPAQVSLADGWIRIEMSIDSLVACPDLTEAALRRQFFGASVARARVEGGAPGGVDSLGLGDPLVAAMASWWAGCLEDEVDFLLGSHLSSEEDLDGCLADLARTEDGSLKIEARPEDDLSFHALMQVLAPRNDRKLAVLTQALAEGQGNADALLAAYSKSLDRLNSELPRSFGKLVDARFKKKDRKRYWGLVQAFEERDSMKVLKARDKLKDIDFLAYEVAWIAAIGALELAQELHDERNPDPRYVESARKGTLTLFTLLALNPSKTRRAPYALEHLARFLVESDQTGPARSYVEELERDFSWVPGVPAKVKALRGLLEKR